MKKWFNFKKIRKSNLDEEFLSTKEQFCVKKNYRHRLEPKYFSNIPTENSKITYQPDVYNFTSILAKNSSCSKIIDIGSGNAKKLVTLYPEFEIIGIDFGSNLNYCRKSFNFGKWIECNLETESIPLIQEKHEKIGVICSDVIEHLMNPSNLLNQILNLMDYAEFCILTTPERDLVRGENDLGPPKNPHHIREWNIEELANLLQNFQLKIAFAGLTAHDDNDFKKSTIIMCLKNNYLKINFKNLIKSTEHTSILKWYD